MKKLLAILILLNACPHLFAQSAESPKEPLSLWYEAPAQNWVTEALPIGNGDMGAMIFGGIGEDRIQFNHKTLWKGSSAATDLGSYLAFGDIYIIQKDAPGTNGYRRKLDLQTAIADVCFNSGNGEHLREYLCSHPDKVGAIRYSSTNGEPMNLVLRLANAQGGPTEYSGNRATFGGKISNGMNYRASLAIDTKGGSMKTDNEGIQMVEVKELTVYFTCGTDFDPSHPKHLTGKAETLKKVQKDILDKAVRKGFEAVKTEHVKDHKALFGRVDFSLHGAKNMHPTPRLLTNTSLASRNMTDILVFQYGRYLTIASSRGIAVPSNLQGIWNKDGNATRDAVWASDIHSNINVQMNYWPAEPANLSECHMPFLNYIRNEALRKDGQWQKNAHDLGVSKGWVVNTAGNIFGGSSSYKLGKYSVANAWYCDHLWQHFTYTRDTTYLRDLAMPVMKSACEFWFERLVPAKNGDGTLECPNEYSPEHGFVQNATAHAQQLVTQLFSQTLDAIKVLGNEASQCNDEFVATLQDKLSRIDKGLRIDKNGMLREWKYQENTPNLSADLYHFGNDEQNVWQCHRHTSHLMGLYPGFSIDKGIDADIFQAAVASLEDRGDISTGWARAWRIALWARTRNQERTYATLRGFAHRTTNLGYDWHGGLYDNMLDAHATSVFQIEGNFGATAGIAEMLMQSRPDSLILLPALPSAWQNGHIHGLKAMGNFEVDMDWKNGKLSSLRIRSLAGMPLTLAYPNIGKAKATTSGKKHKVLKNKNKNILSFNTTKGEEYIIEIR